MIKMAKEMMSRRNQRRKEYRKRFFERDKIRTSMQCALCKKTIKDISSAITFGQTKKPGHFDCILRDIESNEKIGPTEKICYLGKGTFGIISFRNTASPLHFFIRKRIQYEEIDPSQKWYKNLSNDKS